MNKKKQHENKNPFLPINNRLSLKGCRFLVSNITNVELDLENRQIFLNGEDLSSDLFPIKSDSLDSFISHYVDPEQSQNVINSLKEASMGVEKPIPFCFIHPDLKGKFCFEFHYQIAYVSYAKTRLKGKLISLRKKRLKD
jgi:hypothetical protein